MSMNRKQAVSIALVAWLLPGAVPGASLGAQEAARPAAEPMPAESGPESQAPPPLTDPRAWRAALASQAELRLELEEGAELTVTGDPARLVAELRLAGPVATRGLAFELPGARPFPVTGEGHLRLRAEDGELVLVRPGAARDDGQALEAVAARWALGGGAVRLEFPGYAGKLPVAARFEVVFLSDPEAVKRWDRDGDGRLELRELMLPAPPAPAPQPDGTPSASVTATKTDALVVDNGTAGQANPGDVIGYDVTVTAQGGTATALAFSDTVDPDTTPVAGSLNVSPLALDDAYNAVGNLALDVDTAASGILGNDREFLGDTFTLATAGPSAGSQSACGSYPCVVATAQGGTVTLKAPGDGRFTYVSPAGLVVPGTDSFVYVITDGNSLTGSGTVTFNVNGRVWFVDRDAPAGGTGTQASPFNLLATVNGAGGLGDPDGPSDIIYLYDRAAVTDYVGGLELEAGQRLVGSGAPLVVNGTTYLPAGTPPVIENTSGNALTLVAGVTVDGRPQVEGLTINAANNAAVAGTGLSGTLALDSVAVSTSGGGAGLSLTNQAGTLTFGNGSIGGTGTGAAVLLNGGAGSVTLAGTAVNKTAGRLVDVQNKTGGTVTFGALTGTGAATDAIVVQNNSGGTALAFGSGFSLATTAGRGLLASNGGTINVGGTSSTISATGGAALDVTGTSFGAGLTLASASSTGSPAEGLKLSNVTGPVTINGGALSGSTGTAFSLAQGSANVTYAGTVSKTNAGRAVDVQARAGGTATFGGAVTATGASTGINVSGATAASTVSFTGAVDLGTSVTRLTGGTALTVNHAGTSSTTSFADLDVFTTGQAGVDASNGGTFNVTAGSVDAGGRALNLDGLALGATLTNVASSGSAAEGLRLNNATGSLSIDATSVTGPATQGILVQGSSAAVNFAASGSTTVSGGGTQRILVGTSTGNVSFGNTTLSGGTDGVSLQNNSAGTRTFGTLSVSGNSGIGFLHAVGGGATNVTGAATITNPGGTGVDIQSSASAVTFNGLTVNKGASAGTGVNLASNTTGPSFGALAITTSNGAGLASNNSPITNSGGSIAATNGPAINASATLFNSAFAAVSSTNSASQGINLSGPTGTLTMGGGAIGGSAGTAFGVNGGSATVTYSGTVTQNNSQRLVDVQNTTGGSVSIATATGGAASTGVNINAANGNVTFTNLTHGTSAARTANQAVTINGGTGTYGLGTLSLFTTGAAAKGISALNADGGVNSTAGEVNSVGAPAIDIDGPAGLTTLGMTLTAVSASGGANGLLVRDANGTFSVTGTGAYGTGGTIQSMTARGARFSAATGVSLAWMAFLTDGGNQDAAATCGDALNGTNTNCGAAIDLQGVSGVTLSNLNVNGGTQIGINGNDVTNLTMNTVTVQNVGDEVLEDGVQLVNLKGTGALTGVIFQNNFHRQLEVQNSSGTLSSFAISSSTFDRGAYLSTAAQGVLIAGRATASMNVSVKQSSLFRNFGAAVFGQSIDTANVTLTVGDQAVPANGNAITNNSLAVQVVADNGSAQTTNVSNNTATVSALVTSGSTPYSFRKSLNATGLVSHTVATNNIGNTTPQSGNNCAGCNGLTVQDEGSSGGMRVSLTGNTIQHVNQRGIEVLLQLDDALGVVATSNNIANQDSTVGQALFGQSGNDATDVGTLCMDVTSNNVVGLWDTGVIPSGRNMRLRQAPAGGSTAFRLRNIGGTTATDCNNYLNANNTNALAGCSASTGFTTGSAVCF